MQTMNEPMLESDFSNSIMKEEIILQFDSACPEMDEMLHSAMSLFGDLMQLNMQWHSILHAVLWHAIDYAMAIGIAWRVVACK